MNVENKCQQEARQIMQELESVSLDLGLKARIIDSIREMREELEEPCSEPEWKKKIMEADELVSYIAQKAGMSEKQISIDDSVSVTEEEVMEKILEILNRCYEDSGLQNDGYERGYREHAERAERDMLEMTNTEANFKEASSVSAFCDYFKNVAKRYENRMNEEAERYAQELCDGYQGAMKKISKMISALKHGDLGITRAQIYKQWDVNMDGVARSIKNEAVKVEKGGASIAEFGEKNVGEVQKIIQKNEKKRDRMKKIPIYVMLAVLAGFAIAVTFIIKSVGGAISNAGITAESAGETLDLIEKGAGLFGMIAKAAGGGFSGLIKGVLPFLLVALLLAAAFWYLLIKHADKKYKERVCKEISSFMIRQTGAFWKEEPLKEQMLESERRIRRIADEHYKRIFSPLFQNAFPNGRANADARNRLLKLCGEWELVKRSV